MVRQVRYFNLLTSLCAWIQTAPSCWDTDDTSAVTKTTSGDINDEYIDDKGDDGEDPNDNDVRFRRKETQSTMTTKMTYKKRTTEMIDYGEGRREQQ